MDTENINSPSIAAPDPDPSGWAVLAPPLLMLVIDQLCLEDALVARLTCRHWLQAFNARGSTLALTFPYRSEAVRRASRLSLRIRKVRCGQAYSYYALGKDLVHGCDRN